MLDSGAQANVVPETLLLAQKEKTEARGSKRLKLRTYSRGDKCVN